MPEASWRLFVIASRPPHFLVKAPVGLFAGLLSGWLRARPGVLAWIHRTSGAILVALGVKLAFEHR